jgi:hypothetical protein
MTYIIFQVIIYLVLGFGFWNIIIACDQLFDWGMGHDREGMYGAAIVITIFWPVVMFMALVSLILFGFKNLYDVSELKVRESVEKLREYIRN